MVRLKNLQPVTFLDRWKIVESEQKQFPAFSEEDNYLELTSIYYYPEGMVSISIQSETEEWAEQYSSNFNFSLEIWDSVLFLEANRAVINDAVFDVRYPYQ